MTTGRVLTQYRAMSPEDQQTFRRWAKANLIILSIFAAAFAALALVSSSPTSHADRIVAPLAQHAAPPRLVAH
jgi:hypothetical protein